MMDDDITMEIRPGSTCNFACQTCWPEASSRVAQYQAKAGLIDIKKIDSRSIDDFRFLEPIRERIKQVVLLGGEPFYDKSCLRFLDWARNNLQSKITLFTNGSNIDFRFVANYNRPLCIVFSLDAVGKPAEYIRFGTEWQRVHENFLALQNYSHVEVRVNITLSVYNYYYLLDLINLLCQRWPACVTFGQPRQSWLNESSLPNSCRPEVIDRLVACKHLIMKTAIEKSQKLNALNAIQCVIDNLETRRPYQHTDLEQFRSFVQKMDTAKGIDIGDYCDFLDGVLKQPLS
jgi:sulfatase maturation enzyme AslB (radical SAM superfamily)